MAAYGFNETSGSTAGDVSGNANTGTLSSGSTWTTAGKFGGALQLNGTTSGVTVPDAPVLDLTTSMTLEAWVFPTAPLNYWRDIIGKDTDRYYLMASGGSNTPTIGGTWVSGNQNLSAPSALPINTWTHLAATFDGATVRLFVNGVQVASRPETTALTTSTEALTLGYNVYGERFIGRIDEVRVYNRALTVPELQVDMVTPLGVAAGNTAPTISAIAPQIMTEDTGTGALAFTLGDAETAAGSLTLSSSTSNATLVPAANIVFGGSGAARTVTVTPLANQTGTATITLTVSDGQLSTPTNFVVTVTAVNDAPTISAIAPQTMAEDTGTGALAFIVGDAETAAGSLTLSSSTSNATLVPTASIVFGGSGAARTVTVTPAANQTGTATITVTVADGQLSTPTSVSVTVTAVNDAPTITTLANQNTTQAIAVGPLPFTVGDLETLPANLTLSSSTSNATLVPAANIVFGGSGAARTVTVTPAANQTGTATITVSVSDGQLTTPTSFQLTVTASNTAPTISAIAPQTMAEDTGTGALAFTVGDAETVPGSLTLSSSTSNATLVATANIIFGGSGAARTVTVTPLANQAGTATITVTVSDGQLSTPTSFVVTVTDVNDAPTITTLTNQSTTPGIAVGPLSFTVGDLETSLASLTLSSSTSNATLVPAGNIVFGGSGAARTVTVTPAASQIGTATITVSVSDGQLTTPASFQLTVTATPTGLVAAYGFDEESGSTAGDVSGNVNTGTLSSGSTWTTAGKFGGALQLNGTTSGVTVPDAPVLDLTTSMTLEAWVFPTAPLNSWRAVVGKDTDRYYLMASGGSNTPTVGGTWVSGNQNLSAAGALPINTWTHLAATYDGATVRLYANGVQVASRPETTALTTSTEALTLGYNVYGERFIGRIDEVRVYNRALTVPELQADMVTPLSAPRLVITRPAAGATIATTTIDVTYLSVGNQTGVDHVHFRLDNRPEVMDLSLDGNYQFTNVEIGSHTLIGYLVRSDHSAIPNTSASANFTTIVSDTVPPTVSMTSPANGANVVGVIAVAAEAFDDAGVAGVQFKLDGSDLGTEDLTPPYGLPLNTALYTNGIHHIEAVARDIGGNLTVSGAVSFTASNVNPNDPAAIGQWSPTFTWPNVALHSALLPTGKVLTWADHTDGNGVRLWNPATNTFRTIPYTDANLFCAGHTFLADGRLVVAGGHAGLYMGITDTTIFDPWTENWTPAADMTYARWYPTATTLGDGRVLTVSGAINCPSCLIPNDPHNGLADVAEIYNPATNLWSRLTGAPRRLPMYPHIFLLPDGRVFASSANEDPIASVVLDIDAQQWTQIGGVLDGGSAAMFAPGKIVKAGSAWNPDYPINTAASTTYVIDMNSASPAWRQTQSMSFARTEHTLTLLPDGSVLVTGGSANSDVYDLGPAVYEAELWSPATETWTTMARMDVPRHYHSTALLLPDGRVLVKGSGTFGIDQLSAQIYSPPYLFKGPRPSITSAPASAGYGDTFAVQTPDAAHIASVTMMAIGSVTHAFNMNQRIVPVSFQPGSTSIDVTLPINPNLMPPGYYMMFLIDNNGVPSVSSMIKVGTSSMARATPNAAPSAGVQVAMDRPKQCRRIGCIDFFSVERAPINYLIDDFQLQSRFGHRTNPVETKRPPVLTEVTFFTTQRSSN